MTGSVAAPDNSAVDQTLARVREHAAELEARVAVNRELADQGPSDVAAVTPESPEDKARRQLEELKAARDKRRL